MTTQPLTILVDDSISEETVARWTQAGHSVIHFLPEHEGVSHIDLIVGGRCWRANDEMLKSTEGMMFKAARAEKRERTPKPEKKARKSRRP